MTKETEPVPETLRFGKKNSRRIVCRMSVRDFAKVMVPWVETPFSPVCRYQHLEGFISQNTVIHNVTYTLCWNAVLGIAADFATVTNSVELSTAREITSCEATL
jgi:hypothetical protein